MSRYRGPSEAQSRAVHGEVKVLTRSERRAEADDRRRALVAPYAHEHELSTRAVAAGVEVRTDTPGALLDLLRWFKRTWWLHIPEDLHTRGIEWERPGAIIRGRCPTYPDACYCRDPEGEAEHDGGGGTAQGSPRFAPMFRLIVFGDPAVRDDDGEPIDPLRYHLRRMATSGTMNRVAAHYLFRLACMDFDPDAAFDVMEHPIDPVYRAGQAIFALRLLEERMRLDQVRGMHRRAS